MSLIEPAWKTFLTAHRRLLIYAGLGLLLLGVGLFLYSSCDDYFFKRDVDKKKEAANALVEDLKQVNANIAAEKKVEQELITNIAVAANDYLHATNATDATRANVNAAIERQKQAANLNRNVNAQDIEEAMRGL